MLHMEQRLELKRTDEELKGIVNSPVIKFSRELKVKINKVFFRRMKSKWASCSSRKNLTINTLLRYLPKSLIKYVVFHEMTHMIERRHNENFWKVIGKKYKNYRENESDLLAHWFLIQRRNS